MTSKKDDVLNVRIAPELKNDIRELAAFRGLTLSSYVHFLLVKAVRMETHLRQIELREYELEDVPVVGTINKTSDTRAKRRA